MMPKRVILQMRGYDYDSIPSVHPNHPSVYAVLTCRICSRLFWEHQARLIRRENAPAP